MPTEDAKEANNPHKWTRSSETHYGNLKGIYSPMFTAALATITKTWITKCPSRVNWVSKMWYTCMYTV